MSDIFISYSSKDRPWVKTLAEALQSENWSVWWDRTIPAGANYYRIIEQELDAARCVVVVWSRDSVQSDWVPAEAQEGLKRNVLIPVAMEPCTPPLVFRQLQTPDLHAWSGDREHPEYRALANAIGRVLGSPPVVRERRREKAPGRLRSRAVASLIGLLLLAAGGFAAWKWTHPALPEILSFTAFPLKPVHGGNVTLAWQTRNATDARLEGIGVVPASGERTLTPQASTTYTLVAANSRGQTVSKAVDVEMIPPPQRPKPQPPPDVEDPKVIVEKLAGNWMAAWLGGDAETVARLSSEPFYFDQKIVLTREELKRLYLDLFRQKGSNWNTAQIDSIRVQTAREFQESGRDLSKDRIFANLNLSLDDFVVAVRSRLAGRESGMLMMVRKVAGKFEVVGMWD